MAEGWYAELKQRRVFRALFGYGLVSFGLLQVIEPIMHGLNLPEWVLGATVIGLGLGFPVTLVLAWIFDVNAGRVETTAPRPSPRRVLLLAAAGLALGAPGIGWYFYQRHRAPAAPALTASIAVLPLLNLSGDPAQEYFSDGMTEEITSKLSRLRGLAVTARTSAKKYKGTTRSAREIGADLHVEYLVEGSVRRAGDHIRVSASLVRTSDEVQAWADDLDARLDDIFAVQQRVATRIVEALGLKLSPGEATLMGNWGTRNAAAYDEFLQGEARFAQDPDDLAAITEAITHFDKALAIDPDFAPALARLAYAEGNIYRDHARVDEHLEAHLLRAEDAARRALALDPQLPAAVTAAGTVKAMRFDYRGASDLMRRAVNLVPRDFLAWDQLCWSLGYVIPAPLAEAEAACQRAVELQRDVPAPVYHLLRVHALQGRMAEAEADFERLQKLGSGSLLPAARFWMALLGKRPGEALAALEGPDHRADNLYNAWRAIARAQQGQLDQAFALLEQAIAGGYRDLPDLRGSAWWEPLRRDPRWGGTLRAHGLEP